MPGSIDFSALKQQFYAHKNVACGLPADAYTHPDYWQQEQGSVFARHWVFVGFAHELEKVGDVMPVEVGGRPIFLIRNADGEIRAFHNACRHRCLKLVDKKTNVGRVIRCPYHSWVYGLDGALRATPFFGGQENHNVEQFDPGEHGLVATHCEVWFDWVFVNLSAQPDSFEAHVAPLKQRLQGIDFNLVKPVGMIDMGKVRCNWKLLMENFIEPYHVPTVHSSTTNQPLNEHYTIIDRHCLGSGVDIESEDAVPDASRLSVSSLYLTLFPNFVFGRYLPDQIGVHLNIPVGVGHTLQKRVIYTSDGEQRSAREIADLKQLWYEVHKEDHAMCERLQQGRASVVADEGGVLSPHWEDSLRRFQEMSLTATIQPDH